MSRGSQALADECHRHHLKQKEPHLTTVPTSAAISIWRSEALELRQGSHLVGGCKMLGDKSGLRGCVLRTGWLCSVFFDPDPYSY